MKKACGWASLATGALLLIVVSPVAAIGGAMVLLGAVLLGAL